MTRSIFARRRALSDRSMLALAGALIAALMAVLPGAPAHAQAGAADERIIVSGASGQLGGLTVRALLDRGVPANRLILVSRTPEQLREYADLGATVRFGDFTEPESLAAAYAGGTRMLLISVGGSPAEPAPMLHQRAIDAAREAGVRHIAYTSYVGLTRGDVAGRAADHLETEERLKASGLDWTMLRNSIYMDGQVAQAARMVADGRALVPPNESPIGYVTREDCAVAAAAVLATPGHEGRAYDITGPQLVGVRELAQAAAEVTGRPIEVIEGSADARPGFGRPEMSFVTPHFEQLTGRAPTGIRALLAANRAALLPGAAGR
jgi:NAD(P)H dehydrogenase (quinone)